MILALGTFFDAEAAGDLSARYELRLGETRVRRPRRRRRDRRRSRRRRRPGRDHRNRPRDLQRADLGRPRARRRAARRRHHDRRRRPRRGPLPRALPAAPARANSGRFRVTLNAHMSQTAKRHRMSDAERYQAVTAARERFLAGDDRVRGVRPEVATSWYRCREQYHVDPSLSMAPPASAQEESSAEHTLEHEIVFAQLGGAAASIASEVESVGGVVAVTDGAGRILTVQGDKETLSRARESNMAPWSCWSEWATGTNGMGTALEAPGPVLISGPEHWCTGFDEWVCAGVAVRDAVTHDAVAVLDVSTWRADLPAAGRRVAVQGGQRRARGPASARPRQRRRAGRGVRPDASAVRAGARRAGRKRQGRHRRRGSEPLPRRPRAGAGTGPRSPLATGPGPRARRPSRHQAGSSRPQLGRLDADRDRARQRALPDHPAPGLPRRPADRDARGLRIRAR